MVNLSSSLSTYIAYENNGVTLQPILYLDLLKDTYNTISMKKCIDSLYTECINWHIKGLQIYRTEIKNYLKKT